MRRLWKANFQLGVWGLCMALNQGYGFAPEAPSVSKGVAFYLTLTVAFRLVLKCISSQKLCLKMSCTVLQQSLTFALAAQICSGVLSSLHLPVAVQKRVKDKITVQPFELLNEWLPPAISVSPRPNAPSDSEAH